MRLLAILLALTLTTIPALAENVYQTSAQVRGFDDIAISTTATQIIAQPPIAGESVRILALQEMAASLAGGAVELTYSVNSNCSSGTVFAVLQTSSTTTAGTINNVEFGYGTAPIYVIPAGNGVCVISTASVTPGTIAGTYIYY